MLRNNTKKSLYLQVDPIQVSTNFNTPKNLILQFDTSRHVISTKSNDRIDQQGTHQKAVNTPSHRKLSKAIKQTNK